MDGQEIKKNEVWEVQRGENTQYVVVLACFERYAATVTLQEWQPNSNTVPIKVHGIMYADAGRLGYIFYDNMTDFVRVLTGEEARELRKAIGEALDLEVNKVSAATVAPALEARDKAYEAAQQYENMVAAAEAALEAERKEIDHLRAELAQAKEEAEEAYEHMEANAARVDELEEQLKKTKDYSVEYKLAERRLHEGLAAASKEAEIYKGLYEQLLARALG